MNLKQLAKHLKLSPTTVSRALNGYPEVSESTRIRVKAAAQKHNYHPSHHANSLATGKSKAIGHVIPLSEHIMINPHFSDFIAGAGYTYAKSGYDMVIRVVPEAEEEAVYRSFAKDGRVDGVIVHGPKVHDKRIALLQDLGLPFVVHGRTGEGEDNYHWLDVNNNRAFQRGTQFLIDLGHKEIALVNGFESMNFATRRRDGYLSALNDAGIPINDSLMFSGEMIEPQGFNAIQELLAADKLPTAIIFASILPAMGAVRALNERGITLGQDISIVTFDDQLSWMQNNKDIPVFTSLRSSMQEAGKEVAKMLIDLINKPQIEPVTQLWEVDFVLGRSTAPPKK